MRRRCDLALRSATKITLGAAHTLTSDEIRRVVEHLDKLTDDSGTVQVVVTPISFIALGTPAPQGSKRYLGTSKRKGKGILVESSAKVKPWREAVKWAAYEARRGAPPLDAPLVVRMVFTLPKPKSAPKKRNTYPDRTPDLSKLARSTEDAMKDSGLIADDARIVEYARLAKVYPNEDPEALDVPGVRVMVWRKQ